MTEPMKDAGPDLWVHGHVYRAVDCRVGRTRVACDPRGHSDGRSGFVQNPTITLEGGPRRGSGSTQAAYIPALVRKISRFAAE